ncbi:hypothetical protein GO993_21130 [Aeromonas salmonicida subsp. salmonicida]|uniref:hypothetical protein n=1 Tax=Aeromonas salmonicida TaxID=645 RepID=UPI00131FC319|nr:hypothetical protein [Aeromonas salmonicida]QHE46485.1 hypothetical protein GO994_03350 [Aeromonas salmonicida subsp. salmonicida]QJF57537.1 hypothetical protein GO993_21130 [Aeromonas salmonicida subsp. salmonicida]
MKRFTHDADLRGMVVLRSLGFQLVPFKLHRFRKQRRFKSIMACHQIFRQCMRHCRFTLFSSVR